jgi:hypothetical protein
MIIRNSKQATVAKMLFVSLFDFFFLTIWRIAWADLRCKGKLEHNYEWFDE